MDKSYRLPNFLVYTKTMVASRIFQNARQSIGNAAAASIKQNNVEFRQVLSKIFCSETSWEYFPLANRA